MLFSALYSMLPNAKSSLEKGGFGPKQAAWIMIACFLGGVIGIQIISRVLHKFMPSHVVDCEHSHDEEAAKNDGHGHEDGRGQKQDTQQERANSGVSRPDRPRKSSSLPGHMPTNSRKTSMRQTSYFGTGGGSGSFAPTAETEANHRPDGVPLVPSRRPSLQARLTAGITQITSSPKSSCDSDGPCYGYSDPCGQDCFKGVQAKGGTKLPPRSISAGGRPSVQKNATTQSNVATTESTPLLSGIAEEPRPQSSDTHLPEAPDRQDGEDSDPNPSSTGTLADPEHPDLQKTTSNTSNPDLHHHHVPTNAFLSIGLQTSLAIALHKLPEGFITYATNHANPTLGVAVFLALFIHNITEGFAMALPLYLAINSRPKAMAWSFVLGGLSQPVGAGVAALWFKIAGKGDWAPSEGVYGGMFAVTAGIMASVALQLFSESLDLTHSRNLCMIGAFCGMAILGASSALTAS